MKKFLVVFSVFLMVFFLGCESPTSDDPSKNNNPPETYDPEPPRYAPSNLNIDQDVTGGVKITWTDIMNRGCCEATSYIVKYSNKDESIKTEIEVTEKFAILPIYFKVLPLGSCYEPTGDGQYMFKGNKFADLNNYSVQIYAKNSIGISTEFLESGNGLMRIEPKKKAPTVNITKDGSADVGISWNAVTGATSYTIRGYSYLMVTKPVRPPYEKTGVTATSITIAEVYGQPLSPMTYPVVVFANFADGTTTEYSDLVRPKKN